MRVQSEAPDIDVTAALRQVGAQQESFIQFQSVRTLPGSADSTFSFGTHALRPTTALTGDLYQETDRHWVYYYSGTAWKYLAGTNYGTDATRAAITVTANDDGALFITTDTKLWWQVSSGAWTLRDIIAVPAALSVLTKTGAYTLTDADDVIEGNTTGGSFAITLHSAATAKKKAYQIIKPVAANTLTITPPGAETISGAASIAITVQWTAYTLIPNGTNWRIA